VIIGCSTAGGLHCTHVYNYNAACEMEYVPMGEEVAAVDWGVVAAMGGETEAWQLSQGKQTRSGDNTPRLLL